MAGRDRGDFAFTAGLGPRITRKVEGRLVVQRVHSGSSGDESSDDISAINNLLSGVTQDDIRYSSKSGFGRHYAAPGAGTSDGDPYPYSGGRNYDNDGAFGGDLSTIPGGTPGVDNLDILTQPEDERPKEEGDFQREPKQHDTFFTDQDDLWSMDLHRDQQDRNRERGHGTPIISKKSVLDELDDLFD